MISTPLYFPFPLGELPSGVKPNFGAAPNLSHPHIRDCLVWWPFLEGAGLTVQNVMRPGWGDAASSSSTDFDWAGTTRGIAAHAGSVAQQQIGHDFGTTILAGTDPKTALMYFTPLSHPHSGNFERFACLSGSSNQVAFSHRNKTPPFEFGTYDGSVWEDGSTNLPFGVPVFCAYTYAGGAAGTAYTYVNGVQEHTWTSQSRTVSDIVLSGESYGGGNEYIECNWIDFRLYKRALSAAEIFDIYQNILAPFEHRIWVPVSAVTAPTGTGTITLGTSTLASQAVMEPSGSGVLDLDDIILNASGSSVLEPTGSGVLSLDGAILLASGLQEILGTTALTLSDIVLAVSGAQDIPGTATVSLSEVLVDAQGAQEYIATSVPILSTTVLDADGNAAVAPDGTGTLVLDETTLAGAGVQTIPSDGVILLETTVLNASGFSGQPEGTGTLVLDQTALDVQAVMLPDGTAAIVLDLVVLAAQGLGPVPEVTGGPWIIYARRRGRR